MCRVFAEYFGVLSRGKGRRCVNESPQTRVGARRRICARARAAGTVAPLVATVAALLDVLHVNRE